MFICICKAGAEIFWRTGKQTVFSNGVWLIATVLAAVEWCLHIIMWKNKDVKICR